MKSTEIIKIVVMKIVILFIQGIVSQIADKKLILSFAHCFSDQVLHICLQLQFISSNRVHLKELIFQK